MEFSGAKLQIVRAIFENCYRISNHCLLRFTHKGLIIQAQNTINNALLQITMYHDEDYESQTVTFHGDVPGDLQFTCMGNNLYLNGQPLTYTNEVIFDIEPIAPVNQCTINTVDLCHMFLSLSISHNVMTVTCNNQQFVISTPTVTATFKTSHVTFDCEFHYIIKSLRVIAFSTPHCMRDASITIDPSGVLRFFFVVYNSYGSYTLVLSPVTP